MSLINLKVSLLLKWSKRFILVVGTAANQVPEFEISDIKLLYVPVVTLSTQDNVKLLKHLELDFKRTINWNKYQSKETNQAHKKYIDFLIDPSFQGVNTLFLSSFANEEDRERDKDIIFQL